MSFSLEPRMTRIRADKNRRGELADLRASASSAVKFVLSLSRGHFLSELPVAHFQRPASISVYACAGVATSIYNAVS
jgi:hypothetical protein